MTRIIFTLLGIFIYSASFAQQGKKRNADDYREIEEVVVTATRTPKKISNSSVMTQVITAKQIESRGLTDIKSLLSQEVPGLTFNEVGFGTSINMQGLSGKHILFLIDGERMAGESGNNIDYQRINLNNIERIEIVQGAGSAIYGTQAMGGVINIITKKPKDRFRLSLDTKWSPAYQTNYPSIEAGDKYALFKRNADAPNLNGSLTASYRHSKWSTQTTLTHRSADAYALYDSEGLKKHFKKQDLTITLPVSTSPTNVSGFRTNSVREVLTFTPNKRLSLSATGTLYEMSKYDLNPDNLYEYNTDIAGSISGTYTFDNKGMLKLTLSGDQYNKYKKFELIKGRKDLIYKHRLVQPLLSYVRKIGEHHELSLGAEYFDEMLYTDKFTNVGYSARSQHSASLYVQEDWQITPRFGIIAGLRGDYHNAYGFNLAPKAAAIYKLMPVTLRFNYGAGYRSPSIKELHMNWDHLGMFMIYGNSALRPERNHYFSLSSEYVSGRFYALISGYYNSFSNKIEGIWRNNQKELHYNNIESSLLAGLQAQIRFNPFVNGLHLHASASYLHPTKNKSLQLNTQSTLSGTLRAEYDRSWEKSGININLSGSYIGKKEFDVQEDLEQNGTTTTEYYTTIIPAYSLWHVSLSYRHDKVGQITLGVDNIFDYHAGIVSFNSYTGIGRNAFVSLHLKI